MRYAEHGGRFAQGQVGGARQIVIADAMWPPSQPRALCSGSCEAGFDAFDDAAALELGVMSSTA
jgi:hypothetical protein